MDLTHLPVKRKLIIISGALTGLLLSALDQTIVGTALPKIVAELGGIDQYTWVVTTYVLTSTIFVPIFGKLSDIYGRRPLLAIGLVVFVFGSVLAGAAQNIQQLIAFRAIQGIGAASLMANTFTVVADLFPPAERGKWMGLVGAVFGLSSVIGPLLGGYITDNINWRWNFYINLPIGVIALITILSTMPKVTEVQRRPVDYFGSMFIAGVLGTLILALTWGGNEYAWGSAQIIGLFSASAVCLTGFLFTESRAKDPIVPLDMFKDPIVSVSVIATFLTGVGMFGAIIYIPLFAQVVQAKSATNSGIIILPMVLAMVFGAISVGQLISRLDRYKIFALIGCSIFVLGLFLLSRLEVDTPDSLFLLYMLVTGSGLGMLFPVLNISVQNAVAHSRLGVATSLVQLSRGVGATIGLAVMGGIFNSALPHKIEAATAGTAAMEALPPQVIERLSDPQVLASTEAAKAVTSKIPPQLMGSVDQFLDGTKTALAQTISIEFLIAAAFALGGLGFAIFLKEIPLRKQNVVKPTTAPERASAGTATTAMTPVFEDE